MVLPREMNYHDPGRMQDISQTIVIALEARDGQVYTGNANRAYTPATFENEPLTVNLTFMFGPKQPTVALDEMLEEFGFKRIVGSSFSE